MNKEFIAWLCGLLSADGHIGILYDGGRNSESIQGTINISTAERDWAEQIVSILENAGLACHFLECHTDRPITSDGRWRTEFRVDIYKYRPKRKRTGINQWREIMETIKKYKLSDLMIPRKWEILQELANINSKPTGKKARK